MNACENPTAKELLDSFAQFRRLNWKHGAIEGLTRSEIMLLACLRRSAPDDEGMKVSEISGVLRVASPTITQLVNDLEAQGYVERTMDKEDRRVVRVALTCKGQATIDKAWQTMLHSISGLVEYLGETDSQRLSELMSRVFTYFSEIREPEPQQGR